MREQNIEVIKNALDAFELSKVESTIYKTVLNLGSRPAAKIAKHAGLNRTYTYDVLSSLSKKGLVQEIEKNRVKHYSCTPAQHLLGILENRESTLAKQKKELLDALPLLEKLRSHRSGNSLVHYFHGIDGIEKIFEDSISENPDKIYSYLDSPEEGSFQDPAIFELRKRFHARRIQKKVWYYAIAGDSSSLEPCSKKPQENKLKVKTFSGITLPVEIMVYKNKVAILSLDEERVGILVENANTAKALQHLHQTLWHLIPVLQDE